MSEFTEKKIAGLREALKGDGFMLSCVDGRFLLTELTALRARCAEVEGELVTMRSQRDHLAAFFDRATKDKDAMFDQMRAAESRVAVLEKALEKECDREDAPNGRGWIQTTTLRGIMARAALAPRKE